LTARQEEFETHFALADALEFRMLAGEVVSIGETELSARHLLTMKSGLVVHLYNIVEATMTLTLDLIGSAVGSVAPNSWTEPALREWLRRHAAIGSEGGEDSRLQIVHATSLRLLLGQPLGAQKLKKPPGSWSDKLIAKFAKRLDIDLGLPVELRTRIATASDLRNKTPMEFLADRRNAIAHGQRSFEEGASDLTLMDIREIANVTFDYLALAIDAFQNYVDNDHYKV